MEKTTTCFLASQFFAIFTPFLFVGGAWYGNQRCQKGECFGISKGVTPRFCCHSSPPPDVQHNSRISGRPPAHLANGAPPPPSGSAARCAAARVALRLMGREMLLEEEEEGRAKDAAVASACVSFAPSPPPPHRRVWLFVGELCVWVSRAFFSTAPPSPSPFSLATECTRARVGEGGGRGGKGEQDAID